jgi:hypothetical protein
MGEGRIPSKIIAGTESIQNNTREGGDRISLLGIVSLLIQVGTLRRQKHKPKIQTRTSFVVDHKPADELIKHHID